MRRTFLAALIVALGFPTAVAIARPQATQQSILTRMTNAAHAYFRTNQCPTINFVQLPTLPDFIPQRDSIAFVLPSDVPNCTVELVKHAWTLKAMLNDYPVLCRVIVHEFSHLLWIWDSGQGTIFSHVITQDVPVPQCDNGTFRYKHSLYVYKNGGLTQWVNIR